MIKLIIDSNVVKSETIEFKQENKCLTYIRKIKEEYTNKFPTKEIGLIDQLRTFDYDFRKELVKELKTVALGTAEPYLKVKFEK